MATVYLARLLGAGGFERLVAIKRLHPHLEREPDFVAMFLDEARLAARIHHQNVVSILEVGESADGHYLVMEYVEGETFARLLSRAAAAAVRVAPGVVVRVALDALAGLHAAHELTDGEGIALEVVHRDVSPQNILLSADGAAKLADFGVARARSRLSSTETGQLKGKLAYMAPEQARGAAVDRRSDLFAMGTVLWEALAQRRLFKGDQEAETLNRLLYEPIPDVRDSAPHISEALALVCAKALARDPDARYATAADFAEALEAAARASYALGTARDVHATIRAILGDKLDADAERVRRCLAASTRALGELTPPHRDARPTVPAVRVGVVAPGDGEPTHAPVATDPRRSATSSHTTTGALGADAVAALRSPSAAPPEPARWSGRIGAMSAGIVVAVVAVTFGMHSAQLARSGEAGRASRAGAPPEPATLALTSSSSPPAMGDEGNVEAGAEEPPAPSSVGPAVDVDALPAAKRRPGGARGSKRGTRATTPHAPSAPADSSDDLSRNPYR